MSKHGAVYWAGRTWVSKFNLPDSTRPAVALDFVNQKYFDGSNSNASLASLVSGGPTIDANGMLCNATTFNGIGALLAALQTPAVTVRAETNLGISGGIRAIVGIQSTHCPLFEDGGNNDQLSGYNGTTIACPPRFYWLWKNVCVATWNASGRSLGGNAIAAVSDAGTYPSATAVTLGSTWGTDIFGGYLRSLAVYPVRVTNSVLQRISWVLPFLAPLTGSHCIVFAYNPNIATLSYITPGPKLQYERTQPWTCMTGVNLINKPDTAAVVFTNVGAGAPWFGYEVWVDPSGHMRVRLMGNWNGVVGVGNPGLCGVIGSLDIADGKWHTIAATYDGSSAVAGIKLYVDGVLDTGVTTEQNNLASTIISGTPDFWIGNQINVPRFEIGALDNFVMSNIVRSGAYIAANVGVLPAVDGNTVLSYAFEEGTGTTTADGSANNFTGTLHNAATWL